MHANGVPSLVEDAYCMRRPYPLVGSDAALGQAQPEPRVGVVHLHGLHQALEGGQRAAQVQQLNATVVEQLVPLVGQQGTHGDARELLTCTQAHNGTGMGMGLEEVRQLQAK